GLAVVALTIVGVTDIVLRGGRLRVRRILRDEFRELEGGLSVVARAESREGAREHALRLEIAWGMRGRRRGRGGGRRCRRRGGDGRRGAGRRGGRRGGAGLPAHPDRARPAAHAPPLPPRTC